MNRSPRRPGSPISLHVRLTALLALLLLVLSGLVALVLPQRLDAQARRWMESRSLGIARLVASAAEAPVDFDDEAGARRALGTLAAVEGARWALLRRPDGGELARHGEPPPGVSPRGGPARVAWEPGALVVEVPVATRAGATAALLAGFDLAELEARRAETGAVLLSVTLVLLLLGLGGAAVLARFVAAPIRRVTAVATLVAEGDAAARDRLELERRDEVGALARALDRMLGRLFEQREALGRANEELRLRLAELARTQAQLVTADRRTTLGRMAAGVAHEINNPLAAIKGNLAFLAEQAGGGLRGDLRSAVEEAALAAERVRRIVRGLTTFARGDEDERRRLSLAEPVRAALDLVGHEVRQRAALEVQLDDALEVVANEIRLTQVFVNLLANAAQAVPPGAPDRHRVTVTARQSAAGFAEVEVRDTGAGIDPAYAERIFEPFFTTKPVGEGTGLGLSISEGIITSLGGSITFESRPGEGAAFRVRLPAAPRRVRVLETRPP